jgi:hypothetical protein
VKCEPVVILPALPKPETCAQLVTGAGVGVGADAVAVEEPLELVDCGWPVGGVVTVVPALVLQALSRAAKQNIMTGSRRGSWRVRRM